MVARLAKRLGISMDHVYCAGDENNDLSMLTMAAEGFAPANCVETVRSCGATIVADCDHDTLAEPLLLTDRLCCEAREAGSFLGTIARTHAGQGKKLAFLAGGETVVHLTGKGLGGRSQELALAAAPAIAGQKAAVFSVGSDGTDGPTDAAGGYVDGDTAAALAARGLRVFDVLQNNDAYHALQAVGGLIVTGATGTNVNDVAVALVEGE